MVFNSHQQIELFEKNCNNQAVLEKDHQGFFKAFKAQASPSLCLILSLCLSLSPLLSLSFFLPRVQVKFEKEKRVIRQQKLTRANETFKLRILLNKKYGFNLILKTYHFRDQSVVWGQGSSLQDPEHPPLYSDFSSISEKEGVRDIV